MYNADELKVRAFLAEAKLTLASEPELVGDFQGFSLANFTNSEVLKIAAMAARLDKKKAVDAAFQDGFDAGRNNAAYRETPTRTLTEETDDGENE